MSSLDYQAKAAYQRGIKWLIVATLFTGASFGAASLYYKLQNRSEEPITAGLQKVELGTVDNKINEGGTVELGGQRTIKSPQESAVDQVFVKVGDRIVSGQPLIRLRFIEGETALAKKQLEIQKHELLIERDRQKVEEAKTKLKIAQLDYKNDVEQQQQEIQSKEITQKIKIQQSQAEVARQKQKVTEAQEDLAAAEADLNKSNILLERGFIAEKEVDAQKADIRAKQAALRDAELNLKNSISKLNTEQTEFIPIQNTINNRILDAKIELQQSQSDLQQSLSQLNLLKVEYQEQALKLQNNIVTSPLDGMVLNIQVKPGDGVNLRDDLITLGDPRQELVQLQLSTLNASQVKPNQMARITIIGPNSKPFQGRVKQVNLQATAPENSNNQSSSSSGQATVPATVQLDQPTGVLIPGSPVSVEIILEERKNVIVLNTELIQSLDDSPFVWKLDANNHAQKQPVTLGLKGLTQVEIKSGLKVGDTVVIPPPDTPIEPGTPIIEQTEEKEKMNSKE
ncbi:Putative HlyD family secretion protein [Planktothrix tepida]|uniref:HlyD family secretion protein n=2 Tax=Planktothrix TaxID=54304 RepID=A0A9W4CJR5_9CYAN|nr:MULTISPECIES: HlyD family efflux transporter periplasmic adaptor subunit [Planktothrix]CAD5944518.1 Putative HlyD family secretion protein [Planktothrix pseudagardhii]CAD5966262.1 Putative HlyD family secretion protein [Planktothrix tepida]CUR35063.1 putative HlyD family secretion protein [Planktothrix tepida PCC 9214]